MSGLPGSSSDGPTLGLAISAGLERSTRPPSSKARNGSAGWATFQRGNGSRNGSTPFFSSASIGGGTVLICCETPSGEYDSPKM
jgi:hypothetical protein